LKADAGAGAAYKYFFEEKLKIRRLILQRDNGGVKVEPRGVHDE
jgi:hypothetical protein